MCAFTGWVTQLDKVIATFSGHISAVVIPPVPPLRSGWVVVEWFQTIEQLRAWLDSAVLFSAKTQEKEWERSQRIAKPTSRGGKIPH